MTMNRTIILFRVNNKIYCTFDGAKRFAKRTGIKQIEMVSVNSYWKRVYTLSTIPCQEVKHEIL